jgi:hypothetical protein
VDLGLALMMAGWMTMAPQGAQATVAAGAPKRLLPVDDAASSPDFFSFRAHLLSAIVRKDVAVLLAVVDPNIKNGFGGDDGKAAFEREWRPAAADSTVWEVLATILALGGRGSGEDTFIAPYVSAVWPADVDGFEHVAVIGDRVRVRGAPAPDAEELALVSFEVLARARDDKTPEDWTAVTLRDGRRGYVQSRYVRSPIDYRAYFTKKDGRWWMVMLLAGD